MKKITLIGIMSFQVFLAISQVKHGFGALLVDPNYFSDSIPKLTSDYFKANIQLPPAMVVPAPPPGNQGGMGSCVGWSVGYTFFSSYIRRNLPTVWDESTEMSPSFVYNYAKQKGNCDSGTYIIKALNLIRDKGSCLWQYWPYIDGECVKEATQQQRDEACLHSSPYEPVPPVPHQSPSETHQSPGDRHGNFDLSGSYPTLWLSTDPRDENKLKEYLNVFRWPIIVGYEVKQSFMDMWNSNGVWTQNTGEYKGGHSVCIVGYDDNKTFNGKKGMFKCQNQWGLGGDHGYFWVTYELVKAGCFQEAYVWIRDEHAHGGVKKCLY